MKKNKSVIKAVLMISQIGISMIVPIFVGVYIGYKLDQWLGTGFLFLVFLAFGISAAFRNIYILTKPFYAEDLKREKAEQAYWNSLKNAPKEKGMPDAGLAPEEAGRDGIIVRKESIAGKHDSIVSAKDSIAARREQERKRLEEETEQLSGEDEKDPMQEIEEEFNAWRKRNGR